MNFGKITDHALLVNMSKKESLWPAKNSKQGQYWSRKHPQSAVLLIPYSFSHPKPLNLCLKQKNYLITYIYNNTVKPLDPTFALEIQQEHTHAI